MYVLGIDVGTTGTKAIVVDEKGKTVGSGYKGYKLVSASGGIVEQNPEDWYEAAVTAVRQAVGNIDTSKVVSLSMSTQGASSLLVDKDFKPLTNAITWMDNRAVKQKDEISALLGDDLVYRKTGWKPLPCMDLAKYKWLMENDPISFNKASSFVSTLEYMNYRLVGVNVIDPTNAAMRQFMDIETREWDGQLLASVGAEKSKLPEIQPTALYLGFLTKNAAEDLSLHGKVKVYNGAHDQYCSLLGADIIEPGELMLSTGTAWAVMGVTERLSQPDSYIAYGPHIVKGKFGALAALPASGAALDWLKNNVIGSTYEEIDRNAQKRIEKSSGLFFYPYFSGVGFPDWNTTAKACLIGLGLEHDKYDMALSCMEGVVFQLKRALEDYKKNGIMVDTMKVMGGATRSNLWMKIIASLCDCELFIMENKDTACIGAAVIAGVGAGIYENYRQAARAMNMCMKFEEDVSGLTAFYKLKYKKYIEAWPYLEKLFGNK
jgi:Sugar (pentulose and hexulose) kinases